jgi:2-C-methyl-D-erythritol 4-phosphate cytidylyltransferase / 2-C-methyl-D-erythritol 2,4-cyclodiphosphate synthase
MAAAIIVAGGSGTRAGRSGPKQYELLLGRPVLDWSIDAFSRHPDVGQVVVVAAADRPPRLGDAGVTWVVGGPTRTKSVRNGLAALDLHPDTPVLIHDAARPGLSQEMITALLAALAKSEGVAPALPVQDALKTLRDEKLETVPRDGLFRVQTPQAFRLEAIRAALDGAGADLVDDLAAMEATAPKSN